LEILEALLRFVVLSLILNRFVSWQRKPLLLPLLQAPIQFATKAQQKKCIIYS